MRGIRVGSRAGSDIRRILPHNGFPVWFVGIVACFLSCQGKAPAPSDTVQSTLDAAEITPDHGYPPDDAGNVPDDAGSVPDDTGSVPDDTGDSPDEQDLPAVTDTGEADPTPDPSPQEVPVTPDDTGTDTGIEPPSPESLLSACKTLVTDQGGFEPCILMDTCEGLAASLLEGCESGCCNTLETFEQCIASGQSNGCFNVNLIVDHDACFKLAMCWLPQPWIPLADLDGLHLRTLRNLLYRSSLAGVAAAGDSCGVDPEDVLKKSALFLDSLPCRCLWNPASPLTADCQLTVGDVITCAETLASNPCAFVQSAECSGILSVDAEPPATSAAIKDLDCRDRRTACADVLKTGCGQPSVEDWFAVETCVATTESVRCRCLLKPAASECDKTVADLLPCVAPNCSHYSEPKHCEFMCNTQCLPPATAGSDISAAGPVAALDEGILQSWCEWRSCLSGSPGYRPVDCDHNTQAAIQPTVEECVQDLQVTFSPCALSLAQVEACLIQMHNPKREVCDRLGTFWSCALTGDYASCHLIVSDGSGSLPCVPVRQCLEEEWNIVFSYEG